MPISDQTLHVKSFFAASIPQAIERARQELGDNALLLHTKEAPPEAHHLGKFEVVFGCGPRPSAIMPTAAAPGPSGSDDLRQWMEEIRGLLGRIAPAPAAVRFREGVFGQSLLAAGVEAGLAREIDETVRQRNAQHCVRAMGTSRTSVDYDYASLAADLVAEIERRFEVQPELSRITALVGPPGSGKTTTLVKLAITQGLAAGRRVRLISADTQRVGGAEQLRTFASILGVAFYAVESAAALAQTIDSAPADALLFIDTPGYSAPLLSELGSDLANFFAARQDIDTHLVLTASMHPTSLRSAADAYGVFRPRKLLFTRLDETSSYAPVFCEAVQQALPLSFFCHGQDIPEDLVPAAKETVSESLARQLPQSLQAVA